MAQAFSSCHLAPANEGWNDAAEKVVYVCSMCDEKPEKWYSFREADKLKAERQKPPPEPAEVPGELEAALVSHGIGPDNMQWYEQTFGKAPEGWVKDNLPLFRKEYEKRQQ